MCLQLPKGKPWPSSPYLFSDDLNIDQIIVKNVNIIQPQIRRLHHLDSRLEHYSLSSAINKDWIWHRVTFDWSEASDHLLHVIAMLELDFHFVIMTPSFDIKMQAMVSSELHLNSSPSVCEAGSYYIIQSSSSSSSSSPSPSSPSSSSQSLESWPSISSPTSRSAYHQTN